VHAAGIVHRDLKPSNVLIERPRDDGESRVVLTDFGVARSTLEAASQRASIVGTPRYMAPEQASGMVAGPRADVWSLGVVLGEMHAGDARWGAVVTRCRAVDPEARPSVDEVARDLRAISQVSSQRRSIVVVPFRVVGRATDGGLGEVVADELTDVLCTIRELRVVASGAASRLRGERDPEHVHRALAVDAMIDGTIQIDGERVCITARLIDTPSGAQRWRERFDGNLSDLFSFENTIAKRVAEQLRLRVTVLAFDEGVPAEAMRAYLDGASFKEGPMRTETALGLLERAVALHPRFAPALSGLALRSLTAWYMPFVPTPDDWESRCAERVARAKDAAGSLAETHVADAVFRLEHGEVREAELALGRALELSPTCVDALVVLGDLECQTGRTAAGIAHARLAVDLDPGAVMPAVTLAREEALSGRLEACLALLDAIGGDDGWSPPPYLLRVRAASWHGARDEVRGWIARGAGMSDASGRFPYGEMVAHAFLGEADADAMRALVDGLLAAGKSPRFRAETLRVAAEMSAANGRRGEALERLGALGDLPAFVDVSWLERCPALRPLTGERAFADVLAAARARAQAGR
jgi:serine/threonine-protein kinase